MKLLSLQQELIWPSNVKLLHLREFIHSELSREGDPLRWAITSIESRKDGQRILKLEAVVIV